VSVVKGSVSGGLAASSPGGAAAAVGLVVEPEPTEEELAAILSAYEALWPKPAATVAEPSPRWRYAGRWWTRRRSYGGWA